ncbi:unnamed protein product [Kuraishia capsulata CBS 1993]|uniref:DNA repair protein RAD5 n=1 Tax=Kuraishia capsulata CBS 1993 TaxID=1382522 RepID=W6MPH3_9ASCO|nr:uncharacterized protein KUCA_T00004210001 [Kuraishia capsulata CBS 1993]CDK28228.1 unnamed protein product [Kuraishia capsulata CBS 1993]
MGGSDSRRSDEDILAESLSSMKIKGGNDNGETTSNHQASHKSHTSSSSPTKTDLIVKGGSSSTTRKITTLGSSNGYKSLGPPRPTTSAPGLAAKAYGSLAPPRSGTKTTFTVDANKDMFKPIDVSSKNWGKRLDVKKLSSASTSLAPPGNYGPGLKPREAIATHDRWDKFASIESPFKDKEALRNHTGAGFLSSPSKFNADDPQTLELLSVGEGVGLIGDETIKPADVFVKGLDVVLLPHQVHGLRFLKARENPEFAHKGGLLCDDMGLGKTVQAMALILANRPAQNDETELFEHDENFKYKIPERSLKTTLVVCPVALVTQWADEITTKAPGLTVSTYHGPSRERDINKLAEFDVVVTTYSVVMSDANDPAKSPLYNAFWWRVILDEAHTIKNRHAKTAQACFALGSSRRWCLTGTPIQNSLDDLQSLLLFLKVSKYSDADLWKVKVRDVIKNGRSVDALEQLRQELSKIMLRRNKDTLNKSSNALKLPAKNVHVETIQLSPPEAKIYTALEQKILKTVTSSNGEMDYVNALVFLLRLRQAACHWKLLSNYDDDFLSSYLDMPKRPSSPIKSDNTSQENLLNFGKEAKAADDLMDLFSSLSLKENKCEICSETIPHGQKKCASCELIIKGEDEAADLGSLNSAKLVRLVSIVKSDPSRKTIIFSQFTSMLDLIAQEMAGLGIGYVRYQGSMSRQERDQSLEKLRKDRKVTVLLCSLKCGSLGLNLTCASRVILFDPWWNPQIQEQAIDRVYRLGQTVAVDVHQLVSKNTVEERIMKLQDEKRNLAKAVADGDQVANQKLNVNKLSFSEMLKLFGAA